MYLNFDYYITAQTILQIQYDSSLIDIKFEPEIGSGYTLFNSNDSSFELYNWTDLSLGGHIIPNISIVNPSAAISYSLQAILYFFESNTTYFIQQYFL